MRLLFAAAALSLALAAGPVYGQAPAAPAPQQPTPAQPAPTQPAPQKPAPQQPAAQPQPPRPFPEGAKIAYIDVQRVANESAEGKASTSRVKALNDKKVAELSEKQKQLQAAQLRLQKESTVLSDSAAAQLAKDIERMQTDIQRFTQDAQAEVQDLQRELQMQFQRKLMPVIADVGREKGLHVVLPTDGIIWADSGVDITADIIKKLDGGAATPTATQKPPVP
jgi:outer membrane protein